MNDENTNENVEIRIVKKKKTRLKPWAFWTLFIIFFCLFINSCYSLYIWNKDNKGIKNIEKEIEQIVTATPIIEEGTLTNPPSVEEQPEKENTPTQVSDYWYYIKVPFYSVDFTELINKNSDTVAYIHMNNTNVNYPVVQTTDNNYYLTHAFDKSNNSSGWVFLDYRNNPDFSDDNTIIYGHGRWNNTVFGSLRSTLTEKWQSNKDNYTISISTPAKDLVYQIFSIYVINSETYYITPKFYFESDKEKWINTMKERNTVPIDTEVGINDKILTLSTCYADDDRRIVIHARLIKELNR